MEVVRISIKANSFANLLHVNIYNYYLNNKIVSIRNIVDI